MSEIIVNISPEKEILVKEFVEHLGGTVEMPSLQKRKGKGKEAKKSSPTFLFGIWKDADIDARKLREEAWTRKF